jgi:hypothetical protein
MVIIVGDEGGGGGRMEEIRGVGFKRGIGRFYYQKKVDLIKD